MANKEKLCLFKRLHLINLVWSQLPLCQTQLTTCFSQSVSLYASGFMVFQSVEQSCSQCRMIAIINGKLDLPLI